MLKHSATSVALLLAFSPINSAKASDIFDLSIEELFAIEVDSVSGFREKISEAPAPVTVIDSQMIENSGVYTLRDLLTLYVPNFTQVQDQNEYNVAFRGIYTSSQQKFLITLNGHRLNSRAYSMANPDHSIALEKISRIEVSRGPGSSIYGNIALTSVVNIITKSIEDTLGLTTMVESGNHGYHEVYAQYSEINETYKHFSWFKWVKSNGERRAVSPENDYAVIPYDQDIDIYLDRFDHKPSIDTGFTVDFHNNLSLQLNYRQGHYNEPLTTGGVSGEAVPEQLKVKVNGVSPGAQSKSLHLSADQQWQLTTNNSFNFKLYYDTNHIQGPVTTQAANGSFVDVAWRDHDFGFKSKWIYNQANNVLLFGLDFDQSEVTDSKAISGVDGNINGELRFDGLQILQLGSEQITSSYVQYKYNLNDQWLANVGLRYDKKHRFSGPDIKEFSPRAALIYNDDSSMLKLSYAQSFVDPPYWNRYSRLPSFRGSTDLKPEILQSYQLTPAYTLLDGKLHAKFNFYYNQYSDVVFRRTTALAEEPLFINAGEMTSFGLEQEWTYQFENTSLRFLGHHYKVNSIDRYSADNDEIFNIPRNQYNLIFGHQLTDKLHYQLSAKYLGNRRSPINIAINNQPVADPFPNQGITYQAPHNRLGAVVLFNANLRWKLAQTTISFNVQNLFNRQWTQGGSVVHPYEQTGRWFKLGVEYLW
jgi:iron complex outermembrane receptor protein